MVKPCSHSNCIQNNATIFMLTLYNVHVIQCGDFIYKSGDRSYFAIHTEELIHITHAINCM